MKVKTLPWSAIEPPPHTINPRASAKELPEKIAKQAIAVVNVQELIKTQEACVILDTLIDVVEQRIDALRCEFNENVAAVRTERNAQKKRALYDRIASSFRRGYLDFCEFRRLERRAGMLPSDRFETYFSKY